jgi:hypothetical protein
MAEESDSLAPHIAAITRSKRFWSGVFTVLRVLLPIVTGTLVVPAFQWTTTRYGRADAEALTTRVTVLERLVGLPPAEELARVHTVRDRMLEIELTMRNREQAALEREHAIYTGLIAATHRSKAALHEALVAFERDCRCLGTVGDEASPYRCARSPADAAEAYLPPR